MGEGHHSIHPEEGMRLAVGSTLAVVRTDAEHTEAGHTVRARRMLAVAVVRCG